MKRWAGRWVGGGGWGVGSGGWGGRPPPQHDEVNGPWWRRPSHEKGRKDLFTRGNRSRKTDQQNIFTVSGFFLPPERGLIIPAVPPKPAAAEDAAEHASSRGEKTLEATYERLLLSRRAVKRAVDWHKRQHRTEARSQRERWREGQRQREERGFNRGGRGVGTPLGEIWRPNQRPGFGGLI